MNVMGAVKTLPGAAGVVTSTINPGLIHPRSRPLKDSLIAATALVHDLTVVTRNIRDFEPMGVRLLNPWDIPSSEVPA